MDFSWYCNICDNEFYYQNVLGDYTGIEVYPFFILYTIGPIRFSIFRNVQGRNYMVRSIRNCGRAPSYKSIWGAQDAAV